MKSLKSLYLRNLLTDLYKRKIIVIAFVIICTCGFAFLGYKNAKPQSFLSDAQQQELDNYNEKLSEYDAAIAAAEEGLKLAQTQAEEEQRYIDNSIYMKLDAQNIHVASAQYSVQETSNTGNVLSSLVLYINEGGLKNALSEEFADLDVKYWREIITCSTSGNVLNLTILHYDADQVQQILAIAEERIMQYTSEVKKVQGNFNLVKQGSSNYVKADSAVTTAQNNHRNTLKGYLSNITDFNNKVISNQTSKQTYIDKNAPAFLSTPGSSAKKEVLKYAIVGILFGMVLPCAFFALRYILDNRLRSKEDITKSALNVLGSYNVNAQEQNELERSIIAIQILAEQQNITSIYLDCLQDDDMTKRVAEQYKNDLTLDKLDVVSGTHVYEDGIELKNMVSCRHAILIAEAGKTTYTQLEQHIALCKRFSVEILGCIVIE